MPKVSNADYWLAYWSVGTPVRAGRLRKAVKMATPQDVAGLWAAIRANPHDQASWLIAADALDEMGKGGAAKLFRAAAQARPWAGRAEWMDHRYRRGFDMNADSGPQDSLFGRETGGPSVYGHVAGIHVEVHPMTDVCHVKIGSPDPASATGYGWVTHDIGRELMADLDGPHRGSEAAFEHMKREYAGAGPERMRRPRRMARADIPGLYARAWENVRDAAPWGILADALDEEGKGAAARMMRLLAERMPALEDHQVDHLNSHVAHVVMGGPSEGSGQSPTSHGHVAGVPMTVWPLGTSGWPGREHLSWGVYLFRPDTKPGDIRSYNGHMLWLTRVPDEVGHPLLHEMEGLGDGVETDHPDTAKRHLPLPGPERMRRPVRNAAPHEIQQLLARLQGNEQDVGLRGVLADAMDEAGRVHEAGALRASNPIKVWKTFGAEPELRLRQQVDGAWYAGSAPPEVIDILRRAYPHRFRLHIHSGNDQTGEDWISDFESRGTIGRSHGVEPVPLIISSTRSMGGGPVYGDSIVRIRTAPLGRELYRHPTYHHQPIRVLPLPEPLASGSRSLTHEVRWGQPGEGAARRFFSEKAARQWVRKMGLTEG